MKKQPEISTVKLIDTELTSLDNARHLNRLIQLKSSIYSIDTNEF